MRLTLAKGLRGIAVIYQFSHDGLPKSKWLAPPRQDLQTPIPIRNRVSVGIPAHMQVEDLRK